MRSQRSFKQKVKNKIDLIHYLKIKQTTDQKIFNINKVILSFIERSQLKKLKKNLLLRLSYHSFFALCKMKTITEGKISNENSTMKIILIN